MDTINYTGKAGEYIAGIPARDLTTEDYNSLDNDQRATVRKSPLYDYSSYRDALKATNDTTAPDAPAEGAA